MKDETKSQPPTPAVAKVTPAAPARLATAKSCGRLLAAAGMVAAAACAHVKTGTKAGDCNNTPVVYVEGKHLPDKFWVRPAPSNPQQCKGKCGNNCTLRGEPCPAYEGPITLDLIQPMWLDSWRGPPPDYKSPLLLGQTHFFESKETYVSEVREPRVRDVTMRMTALITQMQLLDGSTVPICGVLFDREDREGIPVLDPKYYGEPATVFWGDTTVHLFWPH